MSAPRLLLLIPPLTQLNTPYPSTAYLTGFLKRHGSDVTQADVGIEMVLALLSRDGLSRVFDRVRAMPGDLPGEAEQMLALEQAYLNSIDAVIWFLQGQDPTLAPRICQGGFLPQGPRFAHADEQSGAFGTLGATDRARYLATLYLEDLADLIHETVSPQFALSRYAEHVAGKRDEAEWRRTFLRSEGRVVWRDGARDPEFGMAEIGTPTYAGLALDRYLSVLDVLNPMHRLWSDGHWNKLTVAHGCYWKQCTFCDVGLDYIGRYEATPSEILTDRIEALIAETGRRGFHFVDEAAPPAGLKGLALCLLERGVAITWWGNIRFEPVFTRDLCRLLAASGCVAVTAGLEAASDRLLDAMKKGITVAQAARVAAAFQTAGIMVHAYLMYGFPGETIVETVETLERVRQLFAHGLIQSAFWHRFVATAHSPIGLDPTAHGIRITGPSFGGFAENDLTHDDPAEKAPEWLGVGLRAALSFYMRGEGLMADVRQVFDHPVPRPKVPRNWVVRVLEETAVLDDPTAERRFVWIGGAPVNESYGHDRSRVILPNQTEDVEVRLSSEKADWLLDLIRSATPTREKRGDRKSTRLNSSHRCISYA